jgi:hypothetical protein
MSISPIFPEIASILILVTISGEESGNAFGAVQPYRLAGRKLNKVNVPRKGGKCTEQTDKSRRKRSRQYFIIYFMSEYVMDF